MKQVILVRVDLKMPKGKIAVQCCHASLESVLKSDKEKVKEWREEGSKKVILKVKNEEELLEYKKLAEKNKLVTAMITDAGRTFFKQATKTCLVIGPDKEQKIDKITGHLKML